MVPIADAARGSSWGAIGGLLRGGGSMLGQISGMESPARSLERVAGAAERAAALLDILEREIGVQRAVETLQRVDAMADDIAEMRRSVRAIELAIVDLHTRLAPPLDRIALPRMGRRRRRPDDEPA